MADPFEPVRWLDDNLDRILPPLDTCELDRELLQRAGELALLYRALHGTKEVTRDILGRWREALTAYTDSEEIAEVARKSLPSAWAWLMPYFVLKDLHGHQVPEHEATMTFAIRAGFPFASEVVPYRRFDQNYFLSLHDGRPLDPAGFVRDTALNTCRNLLNIDRDLAYSMTHTLFYLNDFGQRQMPREHPAHGKVLLVLQSLMPHFARRGDWDVLGELLINARCTEGFPAGVLERHLSLFRDQRDHRGFTPPSEKTRQALVGETDEERIFYACCHTTLVSALLDVSFPANGGTVPAFELEPLHAENENLLLERVLEARNRAVLYLNDQCARGRQIPALEAAGPGDGTEEDDPPPLGPSRSEFLSILATGTTDGAPEWGVEDALDLAECFARQGDVEVVARLVATLLAERSVDERVAAVLDNLLQAQKPDGSVGYFLQEGRLLGASDISGIRLGLTHLFIESLEVWLDSNKLCEIENC